MPNWLSRWMGERRRETAPEPAPAPGRRSRNARPVPDGSQRRAASAWPGYGQPIAVAAPRLAHCHSWVMQLQAINWERIEASIADVIVVDTTAEGTEESSFTPGIVERMRTKPGGGDSLVLAYLSIGAAEPWRLYWSDRWRRARPGWMEPDAAGWTGSQRVQFWDPRWQQLIVDGPNSLLADIMAAGFDGVALDGIDTFEHFRANGRQSAPDEMIELVARIGTTAWAGNPNFLIVPINGGELLASPRFRSVISAVIKEDLLFDPEAGGAEGPVAARSEDAVRMALQDLTPALADRIPVLALELLRDAPELAALIPETAQRLRRLGLVPYIGYRQLDRLGAPEA